ncbi:MAG: DNA primase, partial [Stackebrandtia sp.]
LRRRAAGRPACERRRRPPVGPQEAAEREALKLALQRPDVAGPYFDEVDETFYSEPLHAVVRQAVARAGGAAAAPEGANWIAAVTQECEDLAAGALVAELAVEPMRTGAEPDAQYVNTTLARVRLPATERKVRDLKSKLQRVNPTEAEEEYMRMFGELLALEQQVRGLKEQTAGGL